MTHPSQRLETTRGSGAERFARGVALVVGAIFLVTGIWAFVAPLAFFESVASFDPYNAHLIRDIGAFQIGLGVVLVLAVVVRDVLIVALAGVGSGAVFHLLSHIIDRDLGGDPLVDIATFGIVAALLVGAAIAHGTTRRR